MTSKGFLIGMLVGTAVGTIAALLFAPMEGSQTRQKIADSSKAAKDKVVQTASNVKQRVKRQPEAALKQAM